MNAASVARNLSVIGMFDPLGPNENVSFSVNGFVENPTVGFRGVGVYVNGFNQGDVLIGGCEGIGHNALALHLKVPMYLSNAFSSFDEQFKTWNDLEKEGRTCLLFQWSDGEEAPKAEDVLEALHAKAREFAYIFTPHQKKA